MTTVSMNKKHKLWGDVETVKIRMIANDILSFGPTILKKGTVQELPKFMAGQFLANGTAFLIRDRKTDK